MGKEEPRQYYVYILTNFTRVTLYTGVTNNLVRRLYEHKNHMIKGFSDRYNCTCLVYFEETTDVLAAITREKQIKGWLRSRKIKLIETMNPQWDDLSVEWFQTEGPPPP